MSQKTGHFCEGRLRPWLTGCLLPFWASDGFDAGSGAFVEKFEASGLPSRDDYTRVRVQARQIFVFAHAAAAGYSETGLELATSAYAFLDAHAWDAEEGGWFHRLSRRGGVLDRRKDCYDHAFVLLALAWLYRASGEGKYLARAGETFEFLERGLGVSRAGAFDGFAEHQVVADTALPLPRRQNPHMHLLEALLALHEVSGESIWLARAEQLLQLFERHFLDPASGQLVEYFDRDWREVPEGGRCLREPGHFFEWVWLLQRYAAQSGGDRISAPIQGLYDWAWRFGVDRDGPAPDVVFEELDPQGQVLAGGSKRLWPQAEGVKACLALYERSGDAAALAAARRLLAGLFRTFADLESPRWREQVDRGGGLIRPGMPSSSLYHLYLAVAEVLRVLPQTS